MGSGRKIIKGSLYNFKLNRLHLPDNFDQSSLYERSSFSMIKIPNLTDEIQNAHAGQQAAVVDGEFIAFGETLQEVYSKAEELGYDHDDIMIAPIPRPGVLRA